MDALDEADPLSLQLGGQGLTKGGQRPSCPVVCGNRALQLLSAHLHRLPPCVRFIFTTRPDAAAGQVGTGVLQQLQGRKASGSQSWQSHAHARLMRDSDTASFKRTIPALPQCLLPAACCARPHRCCRA